MNDIQQTTEFIPFAKMPRLSRDIIITEKLDGTNAQILIVSWEAPSTFELPAGVRFTALSQDGKFAMLVGSRTRWIYPKVAGEKGGDPDNYGFAAWCRDNSEELFKLGPGRHFGEWFGRGINRAYGLTERRFALFNVSRWSRYPEHPSYPTRRPGVFDMVDQHDGPDCCSVVPVLYRGEFDTEKIQDILNWLAGIGSVAAPGFMNPEGIVIFHTAQGTLFKKTIKNDEAPKGAPGLTNPRQLADGVEAANEAFRQKYEPVPQTDMLADYVKNQ